MSAVDASHHGAVYDRGYRPYDGPRGRPWRGDLRPVQGDSVRRALGIRRSWRQKVAPFVLLGVVTIPAIVNVGVGYVTRDQPVFDRIEIITYREYVGVSSALLLFVAIVAPDVMCPDRRQHVLPLMFARPMTGIDYVFAKVGAIAAILFAFSFIPQVVLFVGNMLVSDSALDYFTGHLDILWKVPAAVFLLALYYAVVGLAIASLTDRRIVAGASIIGLFLITSIASGIIVGDSFERDGGSPAALLNVFVLPLYLRDLVFLGEIDREFDLSGVDNGGLMAIVLYAADRPRRDRRAAPSLSLGGAVTERRTAGSGVRARRHGRGDRRVGVVRPEGRPLGAELLVRAGRHRPARTQRRRQDDADAGDHRARRRQPGHRARRRARPAPRPTRPRPHGARPRGRGGAGGLTARQLVRYVADLHGVAARDAPDDRRCAPSPCSTSPTAGSTASARACASAARSPRRWSPTRACSCSTSR